MKFDDLLNYRLEKTKEILGNKAREYATDDNRLHNFDVAARISDLSPELALKGMWMKHIVSVFDMIDNPDKVNGSMIDEKIGDLINYAILLEWMFLRRIKTDEK